MMLACFFQFAEPLVYVPTLKMCPKGRDGNGEQMTGSAPFESRLRSREAAGRLVRP